MLLFRVTVPITLVVTTAAPSSAVAADRVRHFLVTRLRDLVDLAEPDVLWDEMGDGAGAQCNSGVVEVVTDRTTGTDDDDPERLNGNDSG
jgi:hypothetical protein